MVIFLIYSVYNPTHDYISPELIDIFITNIGTYNTSYIYRLLSEYYNPKDYILSLEESNEKFEDEYEDETEDLKIEKISLD
jgi:hypothetical protein